MRKSNNSKEGGVCFKVLVYLSYIIVVEPTNPENPTITGRVYSVGAGIDLDIEIPSISLDQNAGYQEAYMQKQLHVQSDPTNYQHISISKFLTNEGTEEFSKLA